MFLLQSIYACVLRAGNYLLILQPTGTIF